MGLKKSKMVTQAAPGKEQAEVILVGCGCPLRGMGWYHAVSYDHWNDIHMRSLEDSLGRLDDCLGLEMHECSTDSKAPDTMCDAPMSP